MEAKLVQVNSNGLKPGAGRKCVIVGFAPDSREMVRKYYEQPDTDIWPLNELYMELPDLAEHATGWFQLHGTEPPTVRDPNHAANLAKLKCPIYMWKKHRDIPNSVEYPLNDVLREFDIYGEGMAPDVPFARDRVYLNNSISWMIGLAILHGYSEIHVLGVNMAQSNVEHSEYSHQRPSCEWFLGFARGAGVKVYLPPQSDLCMSGLLYGYDDSSRRVQKNYVRQAELEGRINHIRNERAAAQNAVQQANDAINQLQGALENEKYQIQLGGRDVNHEI